MNQQDVALLVAFLVLFFLFQGEPDVWDKLHGIVMNMESCK